MKGLPPNQDSLVGTIALASGVVCATDPVCTGGCAAAFAAAGVAPLLHRNVQRFRGGLVFQAHRLVYHSTLGLRVMKKKQKSGVV